jgi:hypothetical protein
MLSRPDGQKSRTEEHCFPKWLADHITDPPPEWDHFRATSDAHEVKNKWTKKELAVVARRVCRTCNNGWMDSLEGAVRPFLPRLMAGTGYTLQPNGNAPRLLATWAVKTALCLELATPADQPIPEHHYRSMAELRDTPPPKTQVFLGAYTGFRAFFHQPRRITSMPDGAHAYRSTFIVGHAVFNVMGHSHDDQTIFTKMGGRAQMTPQIWPTLGPVRFPPQPVMDDPALWAYLKD